MRVLLLFICFVITFSAGAQSPADLLRRGHSYMENPWPNKRRPDSALFFYYRALTLSDSLHDTEGRNQALLTIGSLAISTADLTKGKAAYFRVIEYYRKTADKKREADTWLALGEAISVSVNKENLPERLQSLENARSLYQQTKNTLSETQASLDIAETHLSQDKLDLAEKEAIQVLDSYKKLGYKKLHYTYDLMAEVSKLKVDLHNELKYRIEAISSMESTGDTAEAAGYYSRIALVYADLDRYDLSQTWILKSMATLRRRRQYEDYYGDLSLLIYDLIKMNRPREAVGYLETAIREVPPVNLAQWVDANEMFGNCYAAMKSYAKAEQYYMEMMKDYKVTNFNRDFYPSGSWMITDFIHYYQVMATFYISLKQFAKAGPYVTKVLELPQWLRPPHYPLQVLSDAVPGRLRRRQLYLRHPQLRAAQTTE
ncbi:tetratricopeptide repeat protein [Puia sp. P3]|uniref:tetratricopeptide repeat protein n=1 Tax=Puia sp. P3 TaxID=3423952 RepID=UPI003D6746E6